MQPAHQSFIAFIIRSAAAACLVSPVALAQQPAARIDDTFAQQQTARQQQAQINELDDESRRLRDALRQLNDTGEAYAAQNAQLQQSLESQQREQAQLLEQIAAASQTRQEIVPLLFQMVTVLEQFIAGDTPFDLPRRRERVAAARADLELPGMPLADRYRSVIGAWRAELDYAFEVRVARERITLAQGTVLAQTFRVGRAAYYYILPDGSGAGLWSTGLNEWQTLPEKFLPAITLAMYAANEKRFSNILRLPVAVP